MNRSALLCGLVLIAVAAACVRTPDWPPEAGALWKRYVNAEVGYMVDYPWVCTVEEHEGGVLIRYEGAPIISLSHVTEEEAKQRGLWPDHDPVGDIELGGLKGKLYSYDHFDGPFGMHTVSYVVPHRGKWFGLELHMKGDELGTLQKRVVGSITFGAETGGDS